jgi:1-phosphatidylinositol-4-phosphate 5-kinase
VTLERAEYQAEKTVRHGAREEDVPDRTLKTASAPPSMGSITVPIAERRDGSVTGAASVLPVVEEAAEGTTSPPEAQSRNSHISILTSETDGRPPTPAKDTAYVASVLGGNKSAPPYPTGPPPPTPPKTGYGTNLKPESADSGYGVAGGLKTVGSVRSMSGKESINRESLDKELPPLPGMI